MRPTLLRTALVFSALGAALAASAASFVIDTFTTPLSEGPIVLTSPGFDASSDLSSGDAFVTRGVLALLDTSDDPSGFDRLSTNIAGGALSYGTDPAVDGHLQVSYALPFLDLSAYNAIRVNFDVLDQDTPFRVLLAAMDFANEASGVARAGSSSIDFDFSSLSPNPLVRPLTQLTLSVDPPRAGDLRITSIEAVPEPTTLAVLGLGALATLRRRGSRRSIR